MSSSDARPACRYRTVALALALAALGLQGCATVVRPYAALEQNHFRGIPSPSAEEVLAHAEESLPIAASADSVWRACLFLIHQRGGVIRASLDRRNARVLAFVDTPPWSFVPFLEQLAPDEPASTVVTWIAVSVRPVSASETRVDVAWLYPETGRLGRVQDYEGKATLQANNDRKAIARFGMTEFLQALQSQLASGERWRRALAPEVPQGAMRRSLLEVDSRPRTDYEKAVEAGHAIARDIQEQFYVLDRPLVTQKLDQIVARLAQAAGRADNPFRTRLVASRIANATSLPNGQIYVTTALLDAVANQAELAGVLAHEIDHYLQDDYMAKYVERVAAMNRTFNAYVIGATALLVVLCASYPEYCFKRQSGSGATAEQSTGASVAAWGLVGGITAWGIGSIVHVSASVASYSRPQELRADRNGAIYLWRAGYPADGLLRYLRNREQFAGPARRTAGPQREAGD